MTSLIEAARASVTEQYGAAIGQPVEAVTTPALLLDLPAARRNITRMQSEVDRVGVALRPHVKTHKSPDLAQLQVAAGAQGLSTATVWEAIVMAEAGLDDLFVVNTVVGRARIDAITALAADHRVAVAVDDLANAQELARAASARGATLGVLIEKDIGMRRGGLVDSREIVALARQLQELEGIEFRGLTGYEGHCSIEEDVGRRGELQGLAMQGLFETVTALGEAGLSCPIVSAGGTRTWWMTASTPGVTEIQAGTYVLMDRFHTGVEGGFEPALRILGTVVSRSADHLVVDAGSKSIADADIAAIDGWDLANLGSDEEHGRYATPRGDGLSVGAVVQLFPGYVPSTVNLYDAYHVVEDGLVVAIWPIVPRGPGHHGLG